MLAPLLLLLFTLSPASAVTLSLPREINAEPWRGAVQRAGLDLGSAASPAEVRIQVIEGKWCIIAESSRGGARRVLPIAAPRSEAEREDIAVLAASLADEIAHMHAPSPARVAPAPSARRATPPVAPPPATPPIAPQKLLIRGARLFTIPNPPSEDTLRPEQGDPFAEILASLESEPHRLEPSDSSTSSGLRPWVRVDTRLLNRPGLESVVAPGIEAGFGLARGFSLGLGLSRAPTRSLTESIDRESRELRSEPPPDKTRSYFLPQHLGPDGQGTEGSPTESQVAWSSWNTQLAFRGEIRRGLLRPNAAILAGLSLRNVEDPVGERTEPVGVVGGEFGLSTSLTRASSIGLGLRVERDLMGSDQGSSTSQMPWEAAVGLSLSAARKP